MKTHSGRPMFRGRGTGAVIALLVAAFATLGGAPAQASGPAVWFPTASMSTARWQHTATLLPDGAVLVAGGDTACCSGTQATAELFESNQVWSPTGSMATPRSYHRATLLGNGRVLVTGGVSTSRAPVSTAELYTPATHTWSSAGSMSAARFVHTATLMGNGNVLVAGGVTSGNVATSTADVYDPTAGIWLPTAPMGTARQNHVAVLLPSGKVLVAGGLNTPCPACVALTSAELYDPVTGTWSPTGSMTTPRRSFSATVLPNGKVLVAGGIQSGFADFTSSAELYDPSTGLWSPTGTMNASRAEHQATLLPDGTVLVTGGTDSGFGSLASTELYDPSGVWSPAASMATARQSHSATLLPNGAVLAAGGAGFGTVFSSAELYAPSITDTGRAYAIGLTAPGAGTARIADTGPVATTTPGTTEVNLGSTPRNRILSVTLLDAKVIAQVLQSTAIASVSEVTATVGGTPIIFRTITAKSVSSCSGSTGTTSIAYLQVGTTHFVNVAPSANSTISLGSLGTLVLNEQTTVPGGLRVNAVHLSSPATGVDLVISSAESDVEACN